MRLAATSACFALLLASASATPALTKHTPSSQEQERLNDALWLSGLEAWRQTQDVAVTGPDRLQPGEIHHIDVKVTPAEIYVIRWYTDQ